jgi:hypothetical protein
LEGYRTLKTIQPVYSPKGSTMKRAIRLLSALPLFLAGIETASAQKADGEIIMRIEEVSLLQVASGAVEADGPVGKGWARKRKSSPS